MARWQWLGVAVLISLGVAFRASAQGVPDLPPAPPLVRPPEPSPPPVPPQADAGAPPAAPLVFAPEEDAGAPAPLAEGPDAGSSPPAAPLVSAPPETIQHDRTFTASADAGSPELAASPGVDAGPVEPDTAPDFVKGELSHYLGANRITVESTRLGLGLGADRIDNVIYVLLEPRFDLHLGKIGLGLAVPLRLELFNANHEPDGQGGTQLAAFHHAGRFRSADYQDTRDYARVLQYFTYGQKEDPLYVNVGQIFAETLGHGALLRRYQPNIDLQTLRVAAEVDAYGDLGGFEALTNDVLNPNVVGVLGFVKPLAYSGTDPILRSLSIGVSYAADFDAPDALTLKAFPGSGLNGCDCRPVEDPDGKLIVSRSTVQLLGVDAEVKLLKTSIVDVKPFVDFSHLFGGDSGFTAGVLTRVNFGGTLLTPTHALRLIAEGRYLGDHYRASYFDTFYEVDRYIFQDASRSGTLLTQAQAVKQQGFGSRAGYYLEASYALEKWVAATIALEGDSANGAKNLIVHAELPKLFILQLFGSYYKRGFTDFSTLTDFDQSSVAFAGARLELLPILYLNARAYQTFKLDREDTHVYQTTRGIEGDLELGFQF